MNNKESNKILLIIPAYNEEKNIKNTVELILEYNKNNKTNYDYIVINDGSNDGTLQILEDNNYNYINLIHNLGIGGAVQTGYKYAYNNAYDIAIQFDGDGQHDINYVSKIIEPMYKGKYDMVIGSRYIDKTTSDFKSTIARRFGIKIISTLIKYKTKIKIYDTTSGFRAINKNIIKLFIKDYPIEYPEPISTVNVILNNYKIKEIPVKMKKRINGKSSISAGKSSYYMINVFLSILLIKKVK